jgi:hypothetical protein
MLRKVQLFDPNFCMFDSFFVQFKDNLRDLNEDINEWAT